MLVLPSGSYTIICVVSGAEDAEYLHAYDVIYDHTDDVNDAAVCEDYYKEELRKRMPDLGNALTEACRRFDGSNIGITAVPVTDEDADDQYFDLLFNSASKTVSCAVMSLFF